MIWSTKGKGWIGFLDGLGTFFMRACPTNIFREFVWPNSRNDLV